MSLDVARFGQRVGDLILNRDGEFIFLNKWQWMSFERNITGTYANFFNFLNFFFFSMRVSLYICNEETRVFAQRIGEILKRENV